MSISTYVLAFLVMLTFISKNYLLQKQAIPAVHVAYLQCKKTARERRNVLEVEKCLAHAKANKPEAKEKITRRSKATTTTHIPRTEKEEEDYEKERTSRRTSRRSVLNLAPPGASHIFRQTATRLLLSLYSGTTLFKNTEADLKTLVSLILEALQTQKGNTLAERLKDVRASHPILYKMLKGTSTYNLEAKIGCPPLSDFVTINAKDAKAIHFHFASAPLLDALFSERLHRIFFALERKKWQAFSRYPFVTKENLFAILLKEKQTAGFDEIEPYLTFAR